MNKEQYTKERELGDINKNLTKIANEWLVKTNIKQLQRSLEIYERLAKANPAQFEPDLVGTLFF